MKILQDFERLITTLEHISRALDALVFLIFVIVFIMVIRFIFGDKG